MAVVLGAERDGLAATSRTTADQVVALPMLGMADSLNVAIAGAVLRYEAVTRA